MKTARYPSNHKKVQILPQFLPEISNIFCSFSVNDIFAKGLALYRYDRYCEQKEEYLEDGTLIIYVNGQYRGNDSLGKLMSDFNCTNADDMVYTELAEWVVLYKKRKDGGRNISAWDELIKEEREEARVEGATETAKRMFENGKLSISEVAEYSGLSLAEVQKLAAGK